MTGQLALVVAALERGGQRRVLLGQRHEALADVAEGDDVQQFAQPAADVDVDEPVAADEEPATTVLPADEPPPPEPDDALPAGDPGVPEEPTAEHPAAAPGYDEDPWLEEEDQDEVPAGESVETSPPTGEDDVLEETPEFLQETPEHDRLWFEQKPPRDFDWDK